MARARRRALKPRQATELVQPFHALAQFDDLGHRQDFDSGTGTTHRDLERAADEFGRSPVGNYVLTPAHDQKLLSRASMKPKLCAMVTNADRARWRLDAVSSPGTADSETDICDS